jgi:AraC-like DNA-binding protein
VVLSVSPLVRELMLCLGDPDTETVVSQAGITMLFTLLQPLAEPGLQLQLPTDERALTLARALLERPTDHDTLEGWADRLATSASTLRRAFLAETGLTFTEWRTQARLFAALPLLAPRMSIERVALQVGYASTSGFVEAFRRHFGHTPGAHHRPLRTIPA